MEIKRQPSPTTLTEERKDLASLKTPSAIQDNSVLKPSRLLSSTFFLLGLSQLLTWNLFIKSVPFIMSKFPKLQTPNVGGTMSFAYTLANFTTTLTIVLLRWDELMFKRIAPKIVVGFSLSFFVMIAMVALIFLTDSDYLSALQLFRGGIVCFAIGGFTVAILTKAIFALLARFPPILTPFLLGGQALSGITTSLINLVSNVISVTGYVSSWGASLNFILGSTTILVSIVLFILNWKRKNSDFNYFYVTKDDDDGDDDNDWMKEQMVDVGFDDDSGSDGSINSTINSTSTASTTKDIEQLLQKKEKTKNNRITFRKLMKVCRIMWVMGASICVSFFGTVSMFATFLVAERSWKDEHLFEDLGGGEDGFLITFVKSYYQPVTFIVFDIGDFVGRSFPGFSRRLRDECAEVERSGVCSRWVKWGPIVRIFVMFPVFYWLHSVGSSISPATKDFLYMIAILMMGLSNGLFVSTAFLQSSSLVKHHSGGIAASEAAKKQEASGSLLGLFLNFGILLGSMSNFIWKLIL